MSILFWEKKKKSLKHSMKNNAIESKYIFGTIFSKKKKSRVNFSSKNNISKSKEKRENFSWKDFELEEI